MQIKNGLSKISRARLAHISRDTRWRLANVVDPRKVRQWLLLSQSQMGIRLGQAHPNGRAGRPFHYSTIGHIENGDYVVPHQRAVYERVLDQEVRSETDDLITIKLIGKPNAFRVVIYRRCSTEGCNEYFKFDHPNRCYCRRHKK